MALETMASLSDHLSCLFSSFPPSSPSLSSSSLKFVTSSPPCTLPSSLTQQLSITTKIFTADEDDVLNRVVYPSLANANLVFFKSGVYNVEIVPKDGESEEQLVNDFKRSVFRAGVIQETRRRRFFETSQEKRKRKTKDAAKKYRKRRPNPKPKPQSTPQVPKSKSREDEEEDNWELPPQEIDIPYTNRF